MDPEGIIDGQAARLGPAPEQADPLPASRARPRLRRRLQTASRDLDSCIRLNTTIVKKWDGLFCAAGNPAGSAFQAASALDHRQTLRRCHSPASPGCFSCDAARVLVCGATAGVAPGRAPLCLSPPRAFSGLIVQDVRQRLPHRQCAAPVPRCPLRAHWGKLGDPAVHGWVIW